MKREREGEGEIAPQVPRLHRHIYISDRKNLNLGVFGDRDGRINVGTYITCICEQVNVCDI